MFGRSLGDAAALPECVIKTLVTADHIVVHLRSSG